MILLYNSLQVFLNTNLPTGFMELISVEKRLFELVQKEWDEIEEIGITHSQQAQKDVSNTFFVVLNGVEIIIYCISIE